MADISVNKTHALGLAKAKTAAKKVVTQLEKEYNITSEWDGNVLNFERSGVKGQFVVSKDAVSLDINLGFLLKAFKPTIEAQVKKNIDKLFV